MSDANESQASQAVKIAGSDSTGLEQTFVQSTLAGGLHTSLRDAIGNETGTTSNPLAVSPGVDQVIISTTVALGANAAFSSSIIDLSTFKGSELTFNVFADQASAATGLQIQWSIDGTNWDHIEGYLSLAAMAAGNGKTFTQRKVARYLRVVFTNGAIAQTAFRLNVILNATHSKPSSHRLGTDLDDNQDAELVKAALMGRKTTGVNSPVALTANNELRVVNAISGPGLEGAITVGTTPVPLRVGVSNLAGRTFATAHNNGTATIFWGRTASVTSTTGTPFYRNQPFEADILDSADIYFVAASGTHNVRVTES